jgi:hypothetical protein
MSKYLGSTIIEQKNSPFADYSKEDFALYFNLRYGQIDGDHHKSWVIDQVNRILNDTPIIIQIALWSDGNTEFRLSTGEPSQKYLDWVEKVLQRNEFGEPRYSYYEGIAP